MANYDATNFLQCIAGEIPITGNFGNWARYVSNTLDKDDLPTNTNRARTLLRACSGQINLHSPLGQLCYALSEYVDRGGGARLDLERMRILAAGSQLGRGLFWQWFWHEKNPGAG